MTAGFFVTSAGVEIQVDPQSDKDYALAWTSWLNGDTIATSTWAVAPEGPTLYNTGINGAPVTIDGVTHPIGAVTTVWIKTLAVGARYRITNHVTTAAGRVDERSFLVCVRDL